MLHVVCCLLFVARVECFFLHAVVVCRGVFVVFGVLLVDRCLCFCRLLLVVVVFV